MHHILSSQVTRNEKTSCEEQKVKEQVLETREHALFGGPVHWGLYFYTFHYYVLFSAPITYSKMESLQNGCLDAVGCRFGLYRGEKEADRGAQPLLQARINRLCEQVCAAMKA